MPPRNHKNWVKKPNVEYISSKIYSDWDLYSQELDNIFSKVSPRNTQGQRPCQLEWTGRRRDRT